MSTKPMLEPGIRLAATTVDERGRPPRGLAAVTPHWTKRETEALLHVSEAVALKPSLEDVLDVIAIEACRITSAESVSIVIAPPSGPLRLVASRGLSPDYNRFLRHHVVTYAGTMSRRAVDRLTPVVIDDITTDPLLDRPGTVEWKQCALREGFRAMISAPLVAGGRASGALNLYRPAVGPWPAAELELAAAIAQHAASAIDSTTLIESQRRQVDALERLVSVLRDQTHEYANRLQAVSGLLALNEADEARQFVSQLMTLHHESYASVVQHVRHPVLAGLLLAQMSIARQRGVEIKLHGRTRLDALPSSLGSAEAVTIVANLIENAVEAVAAMPADRRRVSVRMSQNQDAMRITVRDWGPGLDAGRGDEIFTRGESSKEGHAGIGLALVEAAVTAAHGTIAIEPQSQGTAFRVVLPWH